MSENTDSLHAAVAAAGEIERIMNEDKDARSQVESLNKLLDLFGVIDKFAQENGHDTKIRDNMADVYCRMSWRNVPNITPNDMCLLTGLRAVRDRWSGGGEVSPSAMDDPFPELKEAADRAVKLSKLAANVPGSGFTPISPKKGEAVVKWKWRMGRKVEALRNALQLNPETGRLERYDAIELFESYKDLLERPSGRPKGSKTRKKRDPD